MDKGSILLMMSNNWRIKKTEFATFLIYIIVYAGYWKLLFSEVSTIFNLLQFSAIACIFLLTLKDRYFWYHTSPLKYFLCIILFLTWRTVLGFVSNSVVSYQRIEESVMTVAFAVILLFAANKLQIEEETFIFDVIIILNLIAVVLYLVIYRQMILMGLSEGLRLGDVNGSSIWTARFCGDAIICCVYNYMKKHKVSYILIGTFFFLVTILTASKGPLLALLIVSIIYYFKKENNSTKKIVMGVVLFIGALGMLIGFQFITNEVIIYRFSLESATRNAPGYRVDRYIYTIKNILSSPFWGNGVGQWGEGYWQQYKVNLDISEYADYPHNIILEICYEMGIGAVGLFLIPIIKCIKKIAHLENGLILAALIIINFLYAFTSGSVIDGNRGIYYWFAICCGVLCRQYSKETSYEESLSKHSGNI